MNRRRAFNLVALGMVATMLGLGLWQTQRLFWKRGLIAQREAALAAAPEALPARADAAWDFRRVAVEGRFRHELEFHLGASRPGGGELGYRILTPLVRADGSAVLVDCGYVPAKSRDPAARAEGQVAGPVRIEGLARIPPKPNRFAPDNQPDRNFWFWIDLPAMGKIAGVDLAPVVVEAGPAPNPGGLPRGRAPAHGLTDDHLLYALTWYAMAAAVAVAYWVWRRKPE